MPDERRPPPKGRGKSGGKPGGKSGGSPGGHGKDPAPKRSSTRPPEGGPSRPAADGDDRSRSRSDQDPKPGRPDDRDRSGGSPGGGRPVSRDSFGWRGADRPDRRGRPGEAGPRPDRGPRGEGDARGPRPPYPQGRSPGARPGPRPYPADRRHEGPPRPGGRRPGPYGRPPGPGGHERDPRPGRWPGAGPGAAYPPVRRPSAAPVPRLGEDEEIVAGRRPVEEAFVARRPARRLLVVPHRRDALEQIVLHATRLRIPILEVEGGSLTAVAGFDGHQGVALVVERRRPASIDEILARAVARGEPPFVLVLDSLEDPQNVGTLLRSAEAAGVHGVVYPVHRQAPITPAAEKASAGAVEHLLLAPVGRSAGDPRRPSGPRDPGRRLGGPGVADRPPGGPAGPARRRRRLGGTGPRCGRATALRSLHPDPDAGGRRFAQRGGGRIDPALRGGGPAGSGRRCRGSV